MSPATQTVDVVVIGAGILGASAAYQLSLRGLRVAVLERGAPNRQGSGATAGNLHVQAIHTKRPGQQIPVDAQRFLPLQKAASDRWTSVEDHLQADIELQRSGGFMVAETEEQAEELKAKVVWEAETGIETELLDGQEARRALPLLGERVLAATWCADDGYVNPLLVTDAYLAAAARHGASVEAFNPVVELHRRGTGWRTVTPKATFDSAAVVNVAGPWISDIARMAGVDLPMTPVAIQMHATVRTPPVLRHLVQHISEGMSVKQVAAGNILIGGGWPAGQLDLHAGTATRVASLLGNVSQAIRILPMLADLRLLRMWSGPLAATADEMPLIGAVPGADAMFVAGGTYAFTFAPLWGELITQLVCGEPPAVTIDDLGPDRLMRGHSLAGTD